MPPSGSKRRRSSGGSLPSAGTHVQDLDIIDALVRQYGIAREAAVQIVQDIQAGRATSTKRLRVSAADDLGHVPSDLVEWQVWRKYQAEPTLRFKCQRPLPPPIPVVLLHKTFMDFVLNLGMVEPSAEDVGFASNFWDALNHDRYVEDHKAQVREIVESLIHAYFGLSVVASVEADIGGVKADALFLKPPAAALFCEFKPQPSAGDPGFQNACYFQRYWATKPPHYQMLEKYALLLNVSGPHMVEVVAASLQEDGKVVWAEIVASFRCFATSAGRMHELTQTARVWMAVKSFVTQYSPHVKQQDWPVPWCLQGYSNVQQPDSSKLVFTYTDMDGIGKAAKLSRIYCKQAHEAWHKIGYAPALDGVDVIGHGWLCIRMEYLAPANQWCSALDVAQELQKKGKDQVLGQLKSCLLAAAKEGHSQGFVHGDFRLCNLMVKPRSGAAGFEVRVLDFDWSGELEHTIYRTQLNPRVMWSPGVAYNEIIRDDHDTWFLGDGFAPQLA